MTYDNPYGGIGIVIKKLRKYGVAVSISNSNYR
jgi:hypothetical protein